MRINHRPTITGTSPLANVADILKGKAAAKAMKAAGRGGGAIVQTGSMWGLQAIGAADAAEALLFLASDQASFITGVIRPAIHRAI